MKKTVFTLLLLSSFSLIAITKAQTNGDPDLNNPGPHRSSGCSNVFIEYNLSLGILSLTYSNPATSFSYIIYDEYGSIVCNGTNIFNEEGVSSVYLGTLCSGNYQIEIIIGSTTCTEEFFVE